MIPISIYNNDIIFLPALVKTFEKTPQTNRKTLDTAACRAQINDDTHSSFVNNIFVDPDQSIYRSLSGGNKQNHEPQMQTNSSTFISLIGMEDWTYKSQIFFYTTENKQTNKHLLYIAQTNNSTKSLKTIQVWKTQ